MTPASDLSSCFVLARNTYMMCVWYTEHYDTTVSQISWKLSNFDILTLMVFIQEQACCEQNIGDRVYRSDLFIFPLLGAASRLILATNEEASRALEHAIPSSLRGKVRAETEILHYHARPADVEVSFFFQGCTDTHHASFELFKVKFHCASSLSDSKSE